MQSRTYVAEERHAVADNARGSTCRPPVIRYLFSALTATCLPLVATVAFFGQAVSNGFNAVANQVVAVAP